MIHTLNYRAILSGQVAKNGPALACRLLLATSGTGPKFRIVEA